MKKVAFQGWKNCVELKSGDFRLIVTTDVGPRVMGGFVGTNKHNIFHVDRDLAGTSGAKEWVNYGGHRLWHSPEIMPRTYAPDNSKAAVRECKDGSVAFSAGKEKTTGITKTLILTPLGGNRFKVEHVLRNDNLWEIEVAAWALSVMAPGGVAVAPQNRAPFALLPNTFYSFWPYTEMNDPRYTFGKDFLLVRQDSKKPPCKLGFNCENGWLSYLNKGTVFTKTFEHFIDAEYPDNGCSIEIYTNEKMLEAETLSPLYQLGPGEEIHHVEEWCAADGAPEIRTEKDAAKFFSR